MSDAPSRRKEALREMKEKSLASSRCFRGLFALLAFLAAALAISACGGEDTPNTDGGLSASELAEKLPDGGMPQATAVDVVPPGKRPALPRNRADEISTKPRRVSLRPEHLLRPDESRDPHGQPLPSRIDHSKLSRPSAAHPYVSDDAVALVSTTQDFDDVASSLGPMGGSAMVTSSRQTATPRKSGNTAVAAADGFVVLGFTPGGVEAAASGDAEPPRERASWRASRRSMRLWSAPWCPDKDEECVELIRFEDFVDETIGFYVTVDGGADHSKLSEKSRGRRHASASSHLDGGRATPSRLTSRGSMRRGSRTPPPSRGYGAGRDRAPPLRLRVSDVERARCADALPGPRHPHRGGLLLVLRPLPVIFWLSGYYCDVTGAPEGSIEPFALAVVSALAFFGSILLHELGHALVALRNGIGISEITFWLFGGLAHMPTRFRTRPASSSAWRRRAPR